GGDRQGGARPRAPARAPRGGRAPAQAAPPGPHARRGRRPRRSRAVVAPPVHPLRGGRPGRGRGHRRRSQLVDSRPPSSLTYSVSVPGRIKFTFADCHGTAAKSPLNLFRNKLLT